MEKKEFYKRFSIIQKSLKVPKENKNSFGNYNFRNAEDILSVIKEHLKEGECIFLNNEIIKIENRFYCQATATFSNGDFEIKSIAQAREEDIKKGMDASQITGSATSYARKYALTGLFGIDNEKYADNDEYKQKTTDAEEKEKRLLEINKKQEIQKTIELLSKITNETELIEEFKKLPSHLKTKEITNFCKELKSKFKKELSFQEFKKEFEKLQIEEEKRNFINNTICIFDKEENASIFQKDWFNEYILGIKKGLVNSNIQKSLV